MFGRLADGLGWAAWSGLVRAKHLLSFFKRDWSLSDYPVRVRRMPNVIPPPGISGLRLVAWHAQIINWPQMFGAGDTRAEARAALHQRFGEYKRDHGAAPRPGTLVPIEFAPTTEIERYAPLARDFFDRILGMNFDACFISDESSLWDFPDTAEAAQVFDRIRAEYGVEAADIENGNLAQIFRRLHEAGHRGRVERGGQ